MEILIVIGILWVLSAACSEPIVGEATPNCWECRTQTRSSNGAGNSDQTNTFCGSKAEMRDIESQGTFSITANGVTVTAKTRCK